MVDHGGMMGSHGSALTEKVGAVVMSSPLMALLLAEVGGCRRNTEALVFGYMREHRLSTTSDEVEAKDSLEYDVVVTDMLCYGEHNSFYDEAGNVDSSRVTKLAEGHEGEVLLGWVSLRRNSPLLPSLRERAVTLGLSQLLSAALHRQTTLDITQLGTEKADKNNKVVLPLLILAAAFTTLDAATHTYEYRALQAVPAEGKAGGLPMMRGVPVKIRNVGEVCSSPANTYSSFKPTSICSSKSDEFRPTTWLNKGPISEATGRPLVNQTNCVESAVHDLLARCKELSKADSVDSTRLGSAERKLRVLEDRLAALLNHHSITNGD